MKLQLFQKKTIKENRIEIYYNELSPVIDKVIKLVDDSNKNIEVSVKNDNGDILIIEAEDIYYFNSFDSISNCYKFNNARNIYK